MRIKFIIAVRSPACAPNGDVMGLAGSRVVVADLMLYIPHPCNSTGALFLITVRPEAKNQVSRECEQASIDTIIKA